VPGQNAYFTFSATAGDDLGLALTGLSLTPSSPNYIKVELVQPNGTYVINGWCYATTGPGCAWSLPNVAQTGTYTLRLIPQGAQTMSFNATLSQDATGALTTGTPASVSITAPGQSAMLTFVATAGQSATLTTSSVSTTPSGKAVTMSVFNPSGTQVASTTGTTLNLTNLVAGTYSVLIAPADGATAALQLLRQ
jgi:hypothetical protein